MDRFICCQILQHIWNISRSCLPIFIRRRGQVSANQCALWLGCELIWACMIQHFIITFNVWDWIENRISKSDIVLLPMKNGQCNWQWTLTQRFLQAAKIEWWGAAPKSRHFRSLNPKLNFNVQAAMLERSFDENLLKAMSHMSLTHDPAVPIKRPKSYVDSFPSNRSSIINSKNEEWCRRSCATPSKNETDQTEKNSE